MAHHIVRSPQDMLIDVPPPPANCTVLIVFGGQVNHSCNNRRLGVCSDEIWQLAICRPGLSLGRLDDHLSDGGSSASGTWELVPELGLTFHWLHYYVDMPGRPRCDFIPIFDRRQTAGVDLGLITGIGGGQLSYNDSSCQAPIETLDDLWFGVWPDQYGDDGLWHYSGRLPFAARRSVQLDDALVSTDELAGEEESPIDKSLTVAGGIAYLSHRFDPEANRSLITAATMYADAWSCTLLIASFDPILVECDWHYSYPFGLAGLTAQPAPSASLPVPLASAASVLFPSGRDLLNLRVGGGTTEAALAALGRLRVDSRTVVGGAANVRLPLPPISLLRQPVAYRSRQLYLTGAASLHDVNASRHHMPLSYSMDEDELESEQSTLATGTSLLLAHTLLYQQGHAKGLFTTWTWPDEAADGAAAAFSLRRLGHSMASTWDTGIISGGQSAGVYSNDWLTFEACVCFWPDDPSYEAELGSMAFRGEVQQLAASYRRTGHMLSAAETGLFRAGVEIEVACKPGWHFHPPLASEVAILTCAANSLWLDVELGAVRRCVRDELQCDWPLVDAGYTSCVEPLPVVDSIEVVTAMARRRQQPVSVDAATVVGVPASESVEVSGELLLVVRGHWLTEPLSITVGAAPCSQPTTRSNESYDCSSLTAGCPDYSDTVVCLLSRNIGVGELVSVSAGRAERAVTISSLRLDASSQGRVPLTVSADEPAIVSLAAAAGECSRNSSLSNGSLSDCSNQHSRLSVELCGANLAHSFSASTRLVTAFVNVTVASEPVPCSGWRLDVHDVGQCFPNAFSALQCYTELLCGQCDVRPVMSRSVLPVAVWTHWPSGALLSNSRQLANRLTQPFIAFQSCAAGSSLVIDSESGTEHCEPCPAGYHAPSNGAQVCLPCWPGTFSAANGSAKCGSCPRGTHSPGSAAVLCAPCMGSSWQPDREQGSCLSCDGGLYRTLPSEAPLSPSSSSSSTGTASSTHPANSVSWTNSSTASDGATRGLCSPCPSGAECYSNGTISARAGFYLVVTDEQLGHVAALQCATTACDGDGDGGSSSPSSSVPPSVRPVQATGVGLINHCAAYREPAADNILCAACLEGYSEVRGVCVPCSSPAYGWLLLVLLLAWLLVYGLHRSTLHLSSTSTIPILVYFAQMSALFLPSHVFAPLSILNLQLFDGMGTHSTCLLPWNGLKALMARIVSPLLVLALLAATLGLQLALRWLMLQLRARRAPRLRRLYQLLFPLDSEQASPSVPWSDPFAPSLDEPSGGPPLHALTQPLLLGAAQSSNNDGSSADGRHSALLEPAPLLDSEAMQPLELEQAADWQPHSEARSAAGGGDGDGPLLDSLSVILAGYRRTLLRLMVFSYNSFATAALSFFHKRPVGEDGERLWEYPAVDPGSGEYHALLPFVALLLTLLVAAVPVLAVLLFLAHRRHQRRLATLRTAAPLRQAVLVEVMIGTFRAGHWPFAVMVLVRRLLLTSIATFVVTASYVWLTAVNTALLVLHIASWPYRDELDNRVEALTLTLLLLETTLLSDWQSSATVELSLAPAHAALLWAMLLLPFAAVAVWAVRHAYLRASKETLRRTGQAGLLHTLSSSLALLACQLCTTRQEEQPPTVAAAEAAGEAVWSVARLASIDRQASLFALDSP